MDKRKTYITMFVISLFTVLLLFAYDKFLAVISVFKPVFYALVIAYLADGLVRILSRFTKLKRGPSIVIVIILILILCGVMVYYAIPFLIEMVRDLYFYVRGLVIQHDTGIYNFLNQAAAYFDIDIDQLYRFDITKLDQNLVDTFKTALKGIYGFTAGTVSSIGGSIVVVITSFVMAIYMLFEKDSLILWLKNLVRAISPQSKESYVLSRFTMANDVFKRFFIGKTIDSLIIGFLIMLLLWVFGIEYAVVFGVISGIGNMIPYFGPIISAVPVVLVLLIINPVHALLALAIIIVVQQLDSHVIGPKVLSDNIGGVSAFWILFAVTVSGIAFGIMGMIVGVPVVVIIKNLIEDFVNIRLKKREPEKKEEALSNPTKTGGAKIAQKQQSKA